MDLLHALPPEIVNCVVKMISDLKELLALRLTCNILWHHATPFAFHDLDISLQKSSLLRLLKIARKPYLARYVRCIWCDMEEFYDVGFGTFKRYIYAPRYERLVGDNTDWVEYLPAELEKKRQRKSYNVYKRYARQQDSMRAANQDLEMLSQALGFFTALKSFHISDRYYLGDWVFGDNRPMMGSSLKILKQEPMIQQHMLGPLRIVTRCGKHHLEVIVRALAKSQTHLHDFSLYLSDCYLGGPEGPLSPFDQDDHAAIEATFRSLKHLDINLSSMIHSSSYDTEGSQALSTMKILDAAPNLEDLFLFNLRYMDGDKDPIASASFQSLVGKPRFKELRRLHIKNVIVEEEVLSRFILHSCMGLQSLVICTVRLLSDTWLTFFKPVRQLPSLERCDINGVRFDYYKRGHYGWATLTIQI